MTTILEYLQSAHRNGNLIPVVGAGFSAATANLPNWRGLLEQGIEYCRRNLQDRISENQIRAMESLAEAGDLVTAFDAMQNAMKLGASEHFDAVHYQGFLNEVFHDVGVVNTDLADAIRALNPRVVLTTNYDTLLQDLRVTSGDASATWLEPPMIRSLLRSGRGVIYLHGRYDVPRSVIMSRSDYLRIVNEQDSISIAQAAFHSGVLVFIASSVGGVGDPHMGRILREFARLSDKSSREASPHVALLPGRRPGIEIAELRRLGIEPLTYGDGYADLPRFLANIRAREEISIRAVAVREVTDAVAKAETRGAAISQVARFIQQEIFFDREVRVTFCEKVGTAPGVVYLEARHVMPPNATRNIFNYPLSIAAWALIEGRIIAWPDDRDSRCNFDLIERLGRLDAVFELLNSPNVDSIPEINRYVNLEHVRRAAKTRNLVLGDFFQDWAASQPNPRYDQFLSVPVPCIESFGNREQLPEIGVFNIDTRNGAPLRDRRTTELLQLAASMATLACLRLD